MRSALVSSVVVGSDPTLLSGKWAAPFRLDDSSGIVDSSLTRAAYPGGLFGRILIASVALLAIVAGTSRASSTTVSPCRQVSQPIWSPDGTQIAFASNRSGKWQIYTMTRDGRDVRAITKVGNNFQPNWSN